MIWKILLGSFEKPFLTWSEKSCWDHLKNPSWHDLKNLSGIIWKKPFKWHDLKNLSGIIFLGPTKKHKQKKNQKQTNTKTTFLTWSEIFLACFEKPSLKWCENFLGMSWRRFLLENHNLVNFFGFDLENFTLEIWFSNVALIWFSNTVASVRFWKFLDISWTISANWYPHGNLNLIVSFTDVISQQQKKWKLGAFDSRLVQNSRLFVHVCFLCVRGACCWQRSSCWLV
jgi:hypothetical protein